MAPIADAIYHLSSDVSAPSPVEPFLAAKNRRSPVFGGNREDRIRSVFGLRSGVGLPPVSRATLLAYCKYLRARLSMPFEAEYCPVHSRSAHRVTVVDLVPPTQADAEASRGLVCLARCGDRVLRLPLVDLEVREENPNSHLIEDYWYWAWNWGIERT